MENFINRIRNEVVAPKAQKGKAGPVEAEDPEMRETDPRTEEENPSSSSSGEDAVGEVVRETLISKPSPAIKESAEGRGDVLELNTAAPSIQDNFSPGLMDCSLPVNVTPAAQTEQPPKKTPLEALKINPLMNDFKNWILDWIPDSIDVRVTLKIVSSVFKEKFSNLNEEMLYKELGCMPHETVSYHLIRTFCQICNREDAEHITEGMTIIRKLMSRAIEEKLVSMDILEGLAFLYTGLAALKLVVMAKVEPETGIPEESVITFIQSCSSYFELPEKAKVAVKATEAIFLGSCRQYSAQQSLLEQIVNEDPETLEWKISYFLALRSMRKRLTEGHVGPGKREAELISQCREQTPEHVMVRLARCMYMGDYAKNNWTDNNEPKVINEMHFMKKVDVFDFIRKEVNVILPRMEHSARINLLIMEIFTSDLPYYLRDNELAKRCLDSALETNPKSSKANHQMAVLLIYDKEYSQAVNYLEVALEADPRNYPAWLDYTSILLRAPGKNKKELTQIFEKAFKVAETSLPDESIGAMMVLKGVFKFMVGNEEKRLTPFSAAHAFSAMEPTNTLKNIDQISNRFQWNVNLCLPQQLYDFFNRLLANDKLSPNDRAAISGWVPELLPMLEDLKKRRMANKVYKDHTRSFKDVVGDANPNYSTSRQTRGGGGAGPRQRQNNDQHENGGPPYYRGGGRGRGSRGGGQPKIRDPINPTQEGRGFKRGRGGRGSRGGK